MVCTVTIERDPTPPPPTPVDPLVKSLQTALDKDPASDKAKVKDLASLFRTASTTLVYKDELKKVSDVKKVMGDAIRNLVGVDSLPSLRKSIGEELNKVLPTTNVDLDKEKRDSISKGFENVGKALEVLK